VSQQINLFNPIFRKRGFSYASATAMLYGIGIAIAIAALVAVFEELRLREIRNQAQAIDQAYKDASARLGKLNLEQAARRPNAQLEAEAGRLETELKSRQEVMAALKAGVVGDTSGFSKYMRAFSRQSISGLWLTAFDIARAGDNLAIQGRTLSPDLVASYLRQLNQEPALQGRRFAALRISRPPPDATAQPTAAPQTQAQDAKQQPAGKERKVPSPRYLEFSISTVELPESLGQTPRAVPAPPPLLGTIESATVLEGAKAGVRQDGTR
jgi:hypothetical protein